MSDESPIRTTGWKAVPLLRLAILPVVLAIALFLAWKLGYFELGRRQQLVDAVHQMRSLPRADIAYVALFGVFVALLLPASLGSLLGGALFGVWKGALLAWVGSLVATVIAHGLTRHLARAPLRRMFGEHRLLRLLRERSGFLTLLRLRIMPVAPFAVLDYVAGIAGVSLRRLIVATTLGVIPSVAAYSYVGSELVRGIVSRAGASHQALLIAGLITAAMLVLSALPTLLNKIRG